MKKTFVTVVPNHIGAFLKASRCFAEKNINITRVSYNKAVDSHMLFIDVEGDGKDLEKATEELEKIGYLQNTDGGRSVLLVEFRLNDVPGSVTSLLELITEFNFNISYMSSQENGSEYQFFKMGLVIEDAGRTNAFIEEAKKLCSVKILDYNHADKVYDNSIFYNNFVSQLSEAMEISSESKEELLVNVNLAMQQLDESGVAPYRTFDSISRFAELLSVSRGDNFNPRINTYKITDNTEITLIEPPCGSNTAIIHSGEDYLFVDSGYACYEKEMIEIFRNIIPDFETISKKMFVTHADVDHCGLAGLFDVIYASPKSAECLMLEANNKDGFREQNKLHKPYIRICKVLTSYGHTTENKIAVVGSDSTDNEVLSHTGFFDFGDLHFEIYEGKGGHLAGENVLIDYKNKVVFSGDVYVNLKDMTPMQAKYNRYAPILMTSVDTDPVLCAAERTSLFQRLGIGEWQIFGGHGGRKLYKLNIEE